MRYLNSIKYIVSILLYIECLNAQGIDMSVNSDISSFNRCPELLTQGKKSNKVPLQVAYSLKKHCPKAGDQGNKDICTGFAFAYGAMSILSAIDRGDTNIQSITENVFSPYYLYHMAKGLDKRCISLSPKALEISMINNGSILLKQFNVNYTCSMNIDSSIIKLGYANRIKSFYLVYAKNESNSHQLIANFQSILSKKKPIVLFIPFEETIIKGLSKTNFLYIPPLKNAITMNHAVTLIGYDNIDSTFEILNSWGDVWGNRGFFKVKYYDLARVCDFAFEIDLYNTSEFIAQVNFLNPISNKHSRSSSLQPSLINLSKVSKYVYVIKANKISFNPFIRYYNPGTYVYTFIITKGQLTDTVFNTDLTLTEMYIAGKDVYEFNVKDQLLIILSKQRISEFNKLKLGNPFDPSKLINGLLTDKYNLNNLNLNSEIDESQKEYTSLLLSRPFNNKPANKAKNDLMYCLINII